MAVVVCVELREKTCQGLLLLLCQKVRDYVGIRSLFQLLGDLERFHVGQCVLDFLFAQSVRVFFQFHRFYISTRFSPYDKISM